MCDLGGRNTMPSSPCNVLALDGNRLKNCYNVPFFEFQPHAPSDGDVGGELVYLPLVCQALAVPAQEFQAVVVGVDRVGKAFPSPLKPYECL